MWEGTQSWCGGRMRAPKMYSCHDWVSERKCDPEWHGGRVGVTLSVPTSAATSSKETRDIRGRCRKGSPGERCKMAKRNKKTPRANVVAVVVVARFWAVGPRHKGHVRAFVLRRVRRNARRPFKQKRTLSATGAVAPHHSEPLVIHASCSSSAAVARSPGSACIARRTKASNPARSGRSAARAATCSAMSASTRASRSAGPSSAPTAAATPQKRAELDAAARAAYGCSPPASSSSVTPSAHTSPGAPCASPRRRSGDMYESVPAWSFTPVRTSAAGSSTAATPKSAIFTRPSWSRSRLLGLMSRCTTRSSSWRKRRPSSASQATSRSTFSSRRRAAASAAVVPGSSSMKMHVVPDVRQRRTRCMRTIRVQLAPVCCHWRFANFTSRSALSAFSLEFSRIVLTATFADTGVVYSSTEPSKSCDC
mmetsp:Transcript_22477/g.69740  ORF Transcript_22477/g.69740 Transcript_22477/m.69740 type:complete len:423 (+) Transcript_22477:294-1562(+)